MFWPASLGGDVSYVIVSGKSMQPTMNAGDLAIVREQSSYEEGDIVAFRVPEGEDGEGAIIIHRIVGGDAESGFILQGDNRESTDRWHPRSEDVIGSTWFHVGGAGEWARKLYEPLGRGAIVGIMAIFLMVGHDLNDDAKKQRRRGGQRMRQPKTSPQMFIPGPTGLWAGAGVLAAVGVGFVALAGYSFLQPATESDFVVSQQFEHTAEYEYTVSMEPSTLYPDGVMGPISATDADRQTPAADPVTTDTSATTDSSPGAIYMTLAQRLDLSFTYALESTDAIEGAAGELSAVLEIGTRDAGWTRSEQILEPTPFTGGSTSATLPVDLTAITALIDKVEDETSFLSPTYSITITPTVEIAGLIGDDAFDESYSSPFSMTLNGTGLTPDEDLFRRDAREFSALETSTNSVAVLGTSVSSTRSIASLAAVVALAAAGGLAALAYFGIGRGENAQIQARYGSMLISVTDADRQHTPHRVRVAAISDLVRLARRDAGVILHEVGKPGSDLYFVDEGTISYEYEVASPAPGEASLQREGTSS